MNLALVAAMTEDRVIGRGNGLPWHLPEDLRLSHGHRVQPAGNRERVGHRSVVVADVEVVGDALHPRGERVDGIAGLGLGRGRQARAARAGSDGEGLTDCGHGRVEGRHLGVDLEPVARREDDGLGCGRGREDRRCDVGDPLR